MSLYDKAASPTLFENGAAPTLLYITKQQCDRSRRDRPVHKHDSICELLLIYQGMGTYQINGKTYNIEAGDVLYYNAGDFHEVTSALDKELGTFCFGFSNVRLKGLPANALVPAESSFLRKSGALYPLLFEMCEFLYRNVDIEGSSSAAATSIFSALLTLALSLQDSLPPAERSSSGFQIAQSAREYIDIHYAEDLSISQIAKAFKCNPSYLAHCFKDAIGYSPMQYLTRCRIGMAQSLLLSSDFPISFVAAQVGFDNPNYFSTVFVKLTGVLPSQYRDRFNEEARGKTEQ